jgi:hypothetical protein
MLGGRDSQATIHRPYERGAELTDLANHMYPKRTAMFATSQPFNVHWLCFPRFYFLLRLLGGGG